MTYEGEYINPSNFNPIDTEWAEAWASNEKERYYIRTKRYGIPQYGIVVVKYKPEVMRLVSERTSSAFVEVG